MQVKWTWLLMTLPLTQQRFSGMRSSRVGLSLPTSTVFTKRKGGCILLIVDECGTVQLVQHLQLA